MCLYVEAYQGHMLNMLCVMPPVFITSLKAFHSVKEQPFMCLIIQLIGHYSRGTVRRILILQQGRLVLLWCWQLSPSLKQCLQYYLYRPVDAEALSNCTFCWFNLIFLQPHSLYPHGIPDYGWGWADKGDWGL